MVGVGSYMSKKEEVFILLIILQLTIYSGLSESFVKINASSSLKAIN